MMDDLQWQATDCLLVLQGGLTALMLAACGGDTAIVAQLLSAIDISINAAAEVHLCMHQLDAL
jgi:hypothetical protein